MKTTLTIFLMTILVSSCSKNTESSVTPGTDMVPPGTVVANGSFTSGVHTTSGVAKVYDDNGTKRLRLEDFKTDNGPDLKIYLATKPDASVFINIGNLKSVTGNQNYDISGMPDFAQYKYVLIWCQQFGVLFGSAQIK